MEGPWSHSIISMFTRVSKHFAISSSACINQTEKKKACRSTFKPVVWNAFLSLWRRISERLWQYLQLVDLKIECSKNSFENDDDDDGYYKEISMNSFKEMMTTPITLSAWTSRESPCLRDFFLSKSNSNMEQSWICACAASKAWTRRAII